MVSAVSAIPAAPSEQAARHFGEALAHETDCTDVHEAMCSGEHDFVLLDVRSPVLYA